MAKYEVNVERTNIEETRELLKIKKMNDFQNIGDLIQSGGSFVFNCERYAVLDIHQEINTSGDQDYRRLIVIDTDGNTYGTSSESAIDTFTELIMDLESYNIPLPQQMNAFKRKGKDTKGEGYILIGLE